MKGNDSLLLVGISVYLVKSRIIGIFPAKLPRLIRAAKNEEKLINANQKRKVRALILLDTGQVITSPVRSMYLAERWERNKSKKVKDQEEE